MPFEVTNYLYALARRLHLDSAQKDEIIQELEAHLEDKTAELVTQGVDHDTAMARAVLEMGASNALARGMYEVHSPGVWRDVLLTIIPHFLLAAFFALHLWSHYFLVSLLLIAIAFVTWRNWRAGNPSKWSYSWMGYSLAAPALSWLLSVITLGYGAWTLLTTGQIPFNMVLFLLLTGHAPLSMWIMANVIFKMVKQDWLWASLGSPVPGPNVLDIVFEMGKKALEQPRRTDAGLRYRKGAHFCAYGRYDGRIPKRRPPTVAHRTSHGGHIDPRDHYGGFIASEPQCVGCDFDDCCFGGLPARSGNSGIHV